MTPVISDNIHAVGYDHRLRVLRVTFKSGGTYEYFDVALHLYEKMLLPHPWRRIGRQIRAHRCRRLAA
ncbi:KTSC domain-containing protein [Nonomuraea sp. NPDC046570]|uniref:KTSC domain-containing protein n=1 Tax=Nonomuraea sp. NPDC046570 TaxID=3155255 RepID=UPI003410415D